jgi:hypothetical protein
MPLLWLLAFVLVVLAAQQFEPEARTLLFVLSVCAIVSLARLLSHATESVAAKTGDAVGGLLNATPGNLTELVIALAALRAGHTMLVKASIAGAIVTNTLFMLGASFLPCTISCGPRSLRGQTAHRFPPKMNSEHWTKVQYPSCSTCFMIHARSAIASPTHPLFTGSCNGRNACSSHPQKPSSAEETVRCPRNPSWMPWPACENPLVSNRCLMRLTSYIERC